MLTEQFIRQLEQAIALIVDEGGHGEVAIPIVNGRPLNYIERRPVIRMALPMADAPPGRAVIGQGKKTG